MNIFESMAHTIIGEHGRQLFRQQWTTSGPYGYSVKFWRTVLLCYGKEIYNLPKRLNLTPGSVGSTKATDFGYPAFTMAKCLELGIPLPELYTYRTVGDYNTKYTPLHLGTALLRFGAGDESREDANAILDIEFMKRLWIGRTAESFVNSPYLNPYRPSDVGRKPLERGDLYDGEKPIVIDEMGNAAWYPTDYLENVLSLVQPDRWAGWMYVYARQFSELSGLQARGATSILNNLPSGKSDTYTRLAKQIRAVLPRTARAFWNSKHAGVLAVAAAFRADSTPAEMAEGLRWIAVSKSSNMETSLRYIGRALTFEDLSLLAPQHALPILRNVNYEVVRETIKTDSERLAGMFFKLPSSQMKTISNCMSIAGREEKWYPDTRSGNDLLYNLTTMSQLEASSTTEWDGLMKPIVLKYLETRAWRKELLNIVDPDVAFLLLTWALAKPDDPVPRDAIENVLRSHQHYAGLLLHMNKNPMVWQDRGYDTV